MNDGNMERGAKQQATNRNHAAMMLSLAKRDLKALKAMRDAENFDIDIFGFHAQQTVEKSLKAWIAFLDGVYPLTHSLKALLDELEGLGAETKPFRALDDLTPFAVMLRYEFSGASDSLDRADIIERTAAIVAFVESMLEASSPQHEEK